MTDLNVPTTFVSGTSIVAADMNANFDAVETFVNTTGVPKLQTAATIDSMTVGKVANVQTFTSSGTWTKPSGAVMVQFVVVAGGAGGGGTNTLGTTFAAGATGSASSIGSVIRANGGSGSSSVSAVYPLSGNYRDEADAAVSTSSERSPGCGGVGSTYGQVFGTPSVLGVRAGASVVGGGGGAAYGVGGAGASAAGNGTAAGANSGGGGGGAAAASGNHPAGGGGGGIACGCMPASAFAATEAVTVGAGGAGGDSNYDGGAGGSGIVIVTTYF